MSIYKAPDGSEYDIPVDPVRRQEFAEAIKAIYPGEDIDQTTILGQAEETLKGIPRGAISLAVDIPLGAASLFDIGNDSDFVQGLKQYKDFLNTESSLAADPAYRDKWMTKLGEGLGSFAPFLGAGKIGQIMKLRGIGKGTSMLTDPMFTIPAALAVPSGIAQQADRIDAARQMGEDVGGIAETFAELGGGLVGLTEILPIFHLLQRVPKHALQVRGVGDRIRSALISGGQEGLQETGASLAQDLIAAGLYSDELPIGESIFDEFTIGGAVGAIADLALTAMSGRNRGSAYIREREQKARNNRISLMEEEKFERAQAQEGVEEITDTPVVVTPDIPLPDKPGPSPQLEVIENPDATFSVIDVRNIEAPVIESFKNKTEAIVAKNKQETNYERRKLTANINNAVYALGMPGSSAAMITGQTIQDPNVAYVNLQTIVNFDSSLTDKQKKLFHKQKIAEGSVGPRSYQEMLANKANSLKAIGDYMKSKGFDLKATYSMPEAKQILSPPNYKKLLEQISTEVFTQSESEEAGEPSIRSDKNEVNVNLKYIRDIAASKNIDLDFKDPAVRYAVQQWTGFQGKWKNSPRHVKELFLARLHSLPKFNTRTKFPDFRPRIYTALDVANFVASAGSQNATFTVKDLLSDKNGITANNKTATEQFISDLVVSGRAEKVKGTNKYQIRKNHEFDIARRAEGFNETPEEFGERLRREGKLTEESIEKLVEDERQNQRKVLPPVEIDKKVINFNEAVEEGRTNRFARKLKEELARVGLETGVIVSNDILSTSNLVQTPDGQIVFDPRATRARKELGARAGQYDRHTDIIFLSLNAVNPDGTATEDQIHDRLSQVLDREMIHAFREKDLIKDKEYEYLRKSVKRRKVPESFDKEFKGKTFYQRAVVQNQNNQELDGQSSQRIEEYYVEEAIAEMYRARNFKPDIPPKAKGILDRIVKFFRAAGRAMRISGFKRTSEIFSDIEQGLVGGRERGVIRTPRELERLPPELIDVPIAQEFEEGKVEPTEPVTPPVTEAPRPIIPFGDIEADTDPITGIVTKPGGYSFPDSSVSEVYDETKLSSSQREQTRNEIISGLVSAGVIRQVKKSNQYEAINPDRASIDMVKWLKDNAPNEDYRILANKALESLNKLSRIGYIFPIELSSKARSEGTRGSVIYDIYFKKNLHQFTMIINNSPSSVKDILEGKVRGNNGVNFETLLHEALHSSTLAQIYSVRDGRSKNPKAVKALKQLTLVQDKVNDYISIKSKEWRDLIYNGKIEELENIRAKESLTMQLYIEVLKTKSNSMIKDFEDHYFKYIVNGIQEGSKKNVTEFITHGFTNRQFQDFLEHIPYSPKGKQSIWNKFVETMRNLIGLPARMNTALSSFLRSASDVVDLGDIGLAPADAPTLDTGPLATATEVIYKGDIENRINEIDVELMPLQSTMNKEKDTMKKRSYDILRKKIDDLMTQRFFLEQQLSKQTSRESRESRAAPIFSKGTRFADNRNTTRNIQLREATEKAVEVVKQTPRGEVPYYNANASDVALEAAVNFNEDQTAPLPPPDIPNYSRGAIPSELEESILRTGYAPSKNTSLGATLLNVINHPIESVRAMFKNFRQNIVDKLDKVDKKILQGSLENEDVRIANSKASTGTMAAMRIADKARGIFRELLMRGYVTDKINGKPSLPKTFNLEIKTRYNPFIDGATGTGGLMQIFAPLYADPTVDLEAVFALYAKVKRIKTMQDNGKVIDSPVTPKDIEQLELIERKYPSVVEAYTNYQDWNNKLIEFAESKGLLSKEQSAMWREHSSYYPFYRDMVGEEGLAAPTIGGGALPSNPLNIKMEGSEREIRVNPVEAIARNSLSILTAAMKNDGTSKLLRDLSSMGEAEYLDSPAKIKAEKNKIFVFEDGQKKYYRVDDTELFHGIQAIGGVKTDGITKFLAFPSKILRDTVTRDPGFIIVNLLRDTLSATVTSGVPISIGGEGFTPIIDTVKNMFADMSELERFGIVGGYDFQNDEGSVKKLMDRARRQQGLSIDNGMNPEDAFYKVWDALGSLTTKSDGATRLAVYEAVYNDMKNRGFNEADAQSEAAYQALEIINFGRRGLSPIFRIITSAIPFMNARIQGLDVLYRSATGKYSAIDKLEQGETIKDLQNKIIRKFGLRASMMITATLLYYLMISDTDEYKAVKREVRDDNWIIPNGTDIPFKIPIPFEVGMLFKAIPERLIDMGMGAITGEGGVEKAPGKSIWRQFGTAAQIPFISGDIGIQALKPLFEAVTNRNSFTNTEIVPYYKLKEEPWLQARQSTNEVARLLGEALNISPMKIEHVLTGYTGTLGGYVLDIMDVFARSITGTPIMPPNINDIPVIKRLFIDLDRSGGLQQQFYELRFEVNRAVATLNDLKKQKRFDELYAFREHNKGTFKVKSQVRAIERYMDNWRRKRDNLLRRTDISAIAKSDMIRDMELSRDKRLAIVPALRQKADVPALSLFN
jgi:hypothetical protein